MNILNLGGGGFIGSHLTSRLLSEGHTVTVVDLWTDKLTELLGHPRLTFIQQDIRNPEWDIEPFVAKADLVIDLIAYANPGLYIRMPLEVFRLNFTENLKIAEACVRLGKRLIQFSTCEVYGRTAASIKHADLKNPDDPIHATFSEDESEFILGPVCRHRWIYACAKQLLERVLHAYGLEQGFNYTIIRPFNFIGPKIDFLLSEQEGIPTAFIVNGLCVGICSVMYSTQFNSIQASIPVGLELKVITAAVVGGVSILGGTGIVIGATLATILLSAISSAMVFVGISPYWINAVRGILILVTVLVDIYRRRRVNRR